MIKKGHPLFLIVLIAFAALAMSASACVEKRVFATTHGFNRSILWGGFFLTGPSREIFIPFGSTFLVTRADEHFVTFLVGEEEWTYAQADLKRFMFYKTHNWDTERRTITGAPRSVSFKALYHPAIVFMRKHFLISCALLSLILAGWHFMRNLGFTEIRGKDLYALGWAIGILCLIVGSVQGGSYLKYLSKFPPGPLTFPCRVDLPWRTPLLYDLGKVFFPPIFFSFLILLSGVSLILFILSIDAAGIGCHALHRIVDLDEHIGRITST